MEKVLILYSNPGDTDRLRLDKEHRMIDQLLQTFKLPSDAVVRRHATTFEDLIKALAETEYTVVQFSSHGSNRGVY